MSQQTSKEIWKPIPNYENEYIVSNLGNFKSLPKTVWNGHGFYITSEKNIKPYKTKKGYLHIDLRDKTFKAHRIVAQVFIPNPLKKPQVNHINGLKYDNRVCNLECWRLMDFTDDEFYAAQLSGVSNSQLYKQAGNSIVVAVLKAIFKELLV